jgi:hypothetical protein
MIRGCLLSISVGLLPLAQGPSAAYLHQATVPLNLQRGFAVAFDPDGNRVWVGAQRGLYAVDLARPSLVEPFDKVRVWGDLEYARDLGRLFMSLEGDAIGWLNVRAASPAATPVRMGVVSRATEMVFEPTQRELYVFSSTPKVTVFDAVEGGVVATIELPGDYGRIPVAVSGRVLLTVARRDGLFAIDARTHRVQAQRVADRTAAPIGIEADPANGRLFLAYSREIVAVDLASGDVRGRVVTQESPAIAFDPGTGLLLATRYDPRRIAVFRPTAAGLELVDQMGGAGDAAWLEPTSRGFLQGGTITSAGEYQEWSGATLVIWKAAGPSGR